MVPYEAYFKIEEIPFHTCSYLKIILIFQNNILFYISVF